ncbi:MAG: TonB-dependent receptor [Saprospiraceae bacterium]|nr:TonB-dependent receptor [Saprospiraceae bacterium]
MKHLSILLAGFFCLLFPQIHAQKTISGIVTNEREELLIGATVFWKNTQKGTVTDTAGRFTIEAQPQAATLVVSYIGYTPAEVEVLPGENNIWIEVSGISQLKEVVVSERGFDTHVSTLDARNIESISSKELRKAPCCNLSESFQTNGAIDVTYPNALTGVKEIQLLGLRGIYSQFMVENRPTMTGIATPFAFEYIPGTWLSGIALAKGASTVKNGNVGITGQINADLVKPLTDKPLFVNAFGSSEGRGELNVHLNRKLNDQTSNGLYVHGSFVENRWDMNDDNFKDSPDRQQLNAMYRLQYDGPAGCAQINVQALTDRRQSGQLSAFVPDQTLFEIDQNNDRVEVWGKYGKEQLFGHRFLELGNMGSYSWHRSRSQFGTNAYQAEQRSVYWQTLLQTIIGTTDHALVVAPSVQLDDIKEQVNDLNLDRRDLVPGMMAEYTYSRSSLAMEIPRFVLVLGGRIDWHSRFGWQATPRVSAKYNFTENSVLRLSGGRGFRSPNVMAENISLLASNRTPVFNAPNGGNAPGVEEAWNYGVNYTQNFKIAGRSASASVDAYRTDFVKQVLVDVDADYSKIYFYSSENQSFSNSVLLSFQYNLLRGLDVKLAAKWNDVRATFADGQLKTLPLVARYRGLVSIDYVTPNKKWSFNTYTQIIGRQRLPDNSQVPHYLTHDFPSPTPVFALVNAQATRHLNKKWELYAGCENIGGYQQHHTIMDYTRPDSPYFNGSQVWAPMMRQVGYIGVRFSPKGL